MQKKSRIGNIIFIIIVFVVLAFLYNIYKQHYFGEFIRGEYIPNLSEFRRDSKVTYGKHDSYRIKSHDFNDAMFYKKVSVMPNTPYRVSCMVKTEGVEIEKINSNAGAGICIADTTECSSTITGTHDWQEIEFMFNSKNRTEVEIGFRLGSYADNCKGIAWFSDLKLEAGSASQDTNWKMVCFVFHNLDITLQDGTKVQESMTASDIQDMKNNMRRLKDSFKQLSNYQMTMDYEIIEITEPITSLSYDDENGYYVSPSDVTTIIRDYVEKGEYDYIYAAIKFGKIMTEEKDDKNHWIGLGGMDFQDIGFANIRLPNDDKSYIYKYSPNINIFPEEAFLHEFLHTLERLSKEHGFEYPILHDHEKYGYEVEPRIGLRDWYKAYMTKNIKTSNKKIGIDSKVYSFKPVHKEAFTYSLEIELQDDPNNIIEEIKTIFKSIAKTLKKEETTINESSRI